MCETTNEKHVYSLVTSATTGTTGTGFDQFVSYIYADPGLAGETDSKDIVAGATAADQLNHLLLQAAASINAAADGVFTVQEVIAMNAWIRANQLSLWTDLHGDDEDTYETGYHLVQNDGANLNYRGDNLLDTVIDGVYHLGFAIYGSQVLNEDGDPNACLSDIADWLTQAYVDHSTTNSGLDRLTDTILADEGLGCNISDADIAAGAEAANGLNRILLDAMAATGIASDGGISASDVATLANYIQGNAALKADWAALHGADSRNAGESGFHMVKGDGSWGWMFGSKFVDSVAEGIYDIGFGVDANGQLLNERGYAGATTAQVADWLNYFLTDQSTTGTGLDHIVDFIKQDRGLAHCTSAADINEGIATANTMNGLIVDLIAATGANADGWINAEDLVKMNAMIRSDPAALKMWTDLHGDDEDDYETAYHLIQNDGANTDFFGRNLVDTVADGIYHMCFEICDGRFLNEDGDLNQTLEDVATWLNFFYNEATIVEGGWGEDLLDGDERSEQINALGGDDVINAAGGDDLVSGSWGDDTIDGGDGNDIIYGDGGNDALSGGAGDDIFRVTGINGDWCTFAGYDSFNGGAGNDSIVAYGGGRIDIGMKAFAADNGIEVIDASDADAVRLLGNWEANTLDFSGVSFVGNISIDAGGGDDTVVGSEGDDVIEGGSWGTQSISGGGGSDTIHGGGSDDTLSGGAGNDTFRVTGTSKKAFEGYDAVDGGEGSDRIVAYGADVDIGLKSFGAGNGIEKIDASGATGKVRLLGNWEANVLDFSQTALVGGNIVIDGGGGDDTITGSAGNDVIEGGTWGKQTIDGGAGDDVIYGGGSDDVLSGGAGNDTFRVTGTSKKAFEGYDSFDGGEGTDRILAFGSSVDIGMSAFGSANGIETIETSSASCVVRLLGDWRDNVFDFSDTALIGKITIDGGGGNDSITGSDGNDLIVGGTGNDLLNGGLGDDVFQITGNKSSGFQGYDTFAGGEGADKLVVKGTTVDIGMLSLDAAGSLDIIDARGATKAVRVVGDWTDNTLDFSATKLVGNSAGAIAIDGGGGADTIHGSAGNDRILGADGNDLLYGMAGNDTLTGGSGYDIFAFGTAWGHDKITDFKCGVDKLNFHDSGAIDMSSLSITKSGLNTKISFGGNDVLLTSVQASKLTAADFIF